MEDSGNNALVALGGRHPGLRRLPVPVATPEGSVAGRDAGFEMNVQWHVQKTWAVVRSLRGAPAGTMTTLLFAACRSPFAIARQGPGKFNDTDAAMLAYGGALKMFAHCSRYEASAGGLPAASRTDPPGPETQERRE